VCYNVFAAWVLIAPDFAASFAYSLADGHHKIVSASVTKSVQTRNRSFCPHYAHSRRQKDKEA
jgi:hypothetical protein